MVQEIFPHGVDVLEEYHIPAINFSINGFAMVFDIYVPSFKIIFEYHGHHHYLGHYLFGDVKYRADRDKERREICTLHGITYIEVPYWWKRDKESVVALLANFRPDIVIESPIDTRVTYES